MTLIITGAENKWETVYKSFAAKIAAGEKLPNTFFGGYDKGMVKSNTGKLVSDKAHGLYDPYLDRMDTSSRASAAPSELGIAADR